MYLDCAMKKHTSQTKTVQPTNYQYRTKEIPGGKAEDEMTKKWTENFFEKAREVQPRLHSFIPQNIIQYCLFLHDENLFNRNKEM